MSDEHEDRDIALVITARQVTATTALVKRGIALTERLVREPLVEIVLPELSHLSFADGDDIAVFVGPAEEIDLRDVVAGGEWVLDWLRNEGDEVTAGELLAGLRFMSGDDTMALRSPVDGVLVEIRAKHGRVEPRSVVAVVQAVVVVGPAEDTGVEAESSWDDPSWTGTNDLAELRTVSSNEHSAQSATIEARNVPDEGAVVFLEAESDNAPVVKLVKVILLSAIQKGASDIHIEPTAKELFVRYRINGVFHEIIQPPFKFRDAITSCVKQMSRLNPERMRQEGRIDVPFQDRSYGGRRMSVIVRCEPTPFGEEIRMSLLPAAVPPPHERADYW